MLLVHKQFHVVFYMCLILLLHNRFQNLAGCQISYLCNLADFRQMARLPQLFGPVASHVIKYIFKRSKTTDSHIQRNIQ